ncbi:MULTISPECIES: spore coat protein [Pseudomonas]|uniref:Spore coat protein n=1 Tax=Pseudomonas mosselii TaxID=78327 RepID=A0A5R8YSV3_9PSED|nr:spore coat protein [Pseudomonas mosselii]TLP56047.1 spore coat protein [Pseudomonas mosselii]
MVGITGISISNPAANQPASTPAQETPGTQTSLQVDGTKLATESSVAGAGKADRASSSDSDTEAPHIKQLRQMIKQLQKQLADEQRQLAQLMAQKTDDSAKLALVTAKQASIATLNGQIQAATAQLLTALTESGGSSAGSVVNTEA